jgi:hypothetical protein
MARFRPQPERVISQGSSFLKARFMRSRGVDLFDRKCFSIANALCQAGRS